MTRIHHPPALAALAILMLPQTALAGELTFCTGIKCGYVKLINRASVTVTSIKMKQLAGPNNCPVVTKKRKRNVAGVGSTIDAVVNKGCPYTVTFKTTKNCSGGKQAEISITDLTEVRRVEVELDRGCGTLQTKVRPIAFGN